MPDDTRLALLEQSHTHISETLVRLEHKLDKIELDGANNLRWLVGIVVSLGITLAGWIHIH